MVSSRRSEARPPARRQFVASGISLATRRFFHAKGLLMVSAAPELVTVDQREIHVTPLFGVPVGFARTGSHILAVQMFPRLDASRPQKHALAKIDSFARKTPEPTY
jgi:hypothetical protein